MSTGLANADDLPYVDVETKARRAVLQRRVNEMGVASLLMALLSSLTIKLAHRRQNANPGEST